MKREEVNSAIAQGNEIRALHFAPDGDHIWTLSSQETTNLSNRIADGTL
jgi:hypothetical protein